jgi:hypothetical protein
MELVLPNGAGALAGADLVVLGCSCYFGSSLELVLVMVPYLLLLACLHARPCTDVDHARGCFEVLV